MAMARGSSVEEVLPVRGRIVARSHFWFWSRTGPDETGWHCGARGGDNGGRKIARFGGGRGRERERRKPSTAGRGALMQGELGMGLKDGMQGRGRSDRRQRWRPCYAGARGRPQRWKREASHGPSRKGRRVGRFQKNNNPFSKKIKNAWIDLIKRGHPFLENFQIKYGIEDLEIENNFPYWSFSKFGIEFELKIKETSRVWIWIEFAGTFGLGEIQAKDSCVHKDDRSLMEFQIVRLYTCLWNLIWFFLFLLFRIRLPGIWFLINVLIKLIREVGTLRTQGVIAGLLPLASVPRKFFF
jgi:hypothetical protein